VETYRFNDAAQILYQFAWHEFCDWYIEQAKIPLTGGDPAAARRAALVLRHVLHSLVLLLHPFIPFITEEIASRIPGSGDTIMLGPFPVFDESKNDPEAEKEMGLLMGLITAVRNIRAEMNIAPSKELPVFVIPSTHEEAELVRSSEPMMVFLGRIARLNVQDPSSATMAPRMSATAVCGEMRVFVPLEGIIDPEAEIDRLEKELARVQKDLSTVEKKLSNQDFLSKAKPEAVEKQQQKFGELSAKSTGLKESLERMRKLQVA